MFGKRKSLLRKAHGGFWSIDTFSNIQLSGSYGFKPGMDSPGIPNSLAALAPPISFASLIACTLY